MIKHHFLSNEVYIKECLIPEGATAQKHKHAFDHISLLTKGCVIVEQDGKQETHYAPAYIEIKEGIEHSIQAINGDAKWYCVNITDCMDEDKIDEVLIK